MTPILYSKSATVFTNLGIGVLTDTVSCVVTEKRNGSFECELVYPVTGALYSYIDYDSIIKAKPSVSGTDQLFRVYKYSKPMNGLVTFSCEHVSYELARAIFGKIESATGKTAAQIYALAVAAAPYVPPGYTFTSSVSGTTGISIEYDSIRAAIFETRDLLGGELEWDNRAIKLHSSRGRDTGIIIAYGKNMTDINAEGDVTDLCTALYPYAIDADGNTVTLSPKLITHTNNSSYAYTRVVAVDLTDEISGEINATNLRTAANAYMSASKAFYPEENITVSFEPLGNSVEYENVTALETVSLCDTVNIRHSVLGLNVSAKVITTVYDVLREKYESIELGTRKTDLYNTFSKIFDVESIANDANNTANGASATANSASNSAALTQANLEAYISGHFSIGSYVGDGTHSYSGGGQTIELAFTPSVVIIFTSDYLVTTSGTGAASTYFGFLTTGNVLSTCEIVDGGFYVSDSGGGYYLLNAVNKTYYYIAML